MGNTDPLLQMKKLEAQRRKATYPRSPNSRGTRTDIPVWAWLQSQHYQAIRSFTEPTRCQAVLGTGARSQMLWSWFSNASPTPARTGRPAGPRVGGPRPWPPSHLGARSRPRCVGGESRHLHGPQTSDLFTGGYRGPQGSRNWALLARVRKGRMPESTAKGCGTVDGV